MMGRRRVLDDRSERGTVLLENALAVPLVILFVIGAAELGLGILNRTQAASAARDGARRGILSYWQADIAGSSDAAAIAGAISQRLGDRTFVAAIHCVGPSDTTPLPGGCAAASVLSGDRIQVAVSWQAPGLREASGIALMGLSGLPMLAGAP